MAYQYYASDTSENSPQPTYFANGNGNDNHHQSTSFANSNHNHRNQRGNKQARRGVRKSGTIKSRDYENDATPGSSNAQVDASYISPVVASSAVQRFLALRIREEGFERAECAALVRLEMEVVAFIEQIFSRAKAFADNSGRGRPAAPDLLAAAQEYDLNVSELAQEHRESRKRAQTRKHSENSLNLELVPPERRPSSPELLASDDENTPPVVPETLRSLPEHLPPLPPRHTYLRTPIPPPKKQALPSLEKKLENAALVQESLRSLLLATEVDADANDGELFGGVVNWEATRHPRKKWKITS